MPTRLSRLARRRREERLKKELQESLLPERPPLLDKAEMYRSFDAGYFGNRVRYWRSREEIEQDSYRGLFSIRSKVRANPVALYEIPYAKLDEAIARLPHSHRNPGLLFFETPPHHKNVIQGEVLRHYDLVLEYTRAPGPMRHAFAAERLVAHGITAKLILQDRLDPADYDDLMRLLELYPGHVVEFSTFRIPVGTVPGRKTVVWEVRFY